MSSEQSLDPQLIEQTRQQIRTLVQEIAQIAKSEIAPEEFYAEFLPRVVNALAAVGGVVWSRDDQGRLALQYQVNLQETELHVKGDDDQMRHGRLLHKVISTGEGVLVQPHSGFGEGDQASNPTDFLLVLGALKTELEVVGVVEIFQRSDTEPRTQAGYLRFVLQMCDLAGDFLKSRQLRSFSDRQVLWTQLEEFARLIHASLDPRDTAYTIANEGRRLIECDRVSVAVRKGRRCTIEAVSGQDLFDKRSNTVRLLGKLASVVVASGEPVWYTGDTTNLAPQVEDALQEYVDESHTKALAVLPLRRPILTEKEKERPDDPNEVSPAVGALIVEQIEDSRVPAKLMQRTEVVCQHSSTAMANAIEHQDLFLMPLWRALGKTKVVTHARTLPKVLLGLIAAVALIVAMIFVQWDFKPKSTGTLEPVERSNLFAGTDGVVEEVLVDHAQNVKKRQLLVRMHSFRIEQEMIKVRKELEGTNESIKRTLSGLLQRDVNGMERENSLMATSRSDELSAQLAELRVKKSGLEEELKILEKESRELEVRSPVDGQIITWEPYNRLNARPVQKGQMLLQVADAAKDWRIELNLPDDRVAFLRRAQLERYGKLRHEVREALRGQRREAVGQRVRAALDDQLPAVRPPIKSAVEGDVTGSIANDAPESETPQSPATPSNPQQEQEKRVDAAIASELDAEVEAELSQIPDQDLKKKLFELTGREEDDRLKVEYILATDPGTRHYGFVEEIGMSAEVRGEEGNTIKVKVTIDKNDIKPEDLQHGTTVTAKVDCGRRALGYVLFHDVFAWGEKMLFRWF